MIRRLKLWRRKSGVSLLSFFSCLSTQLWLVHHSHFIVSDVCRPIKVRRVGCSYGCWPSNPRDVATASPTASGQQKCDGGHHDTDTTDLGRRRLDTDSLRPAGRRRPPPLRQYPPHSADRPGARAACCIQNQTTRMAARSAARKQASLADFACHPFGDVAGCFMVPRAVMRRYRAARGAFEGHGLVGHITFTGT